MKILGFGTMRLPLLDKSDIKSVDIEKFEQMVDLFMERGFNYFDTAYMYHGGQSERAVKKALVQRYPRESFLLADKLHAAFVKCEADNERVFNEQLSRCGVEYFDYYLVHGLNKDIYARAEKYGTFEFVGRMKNEGKIKHLGFSFHDDAEMLERILRERPELEFVQLQINYLDWDDAVVQSGACYEVARKYGKPIIVMEPVKGGRLAKLPKATEELCGSYGVDASPASLAVRFCAGLDGVFMVLSGMSELEQVRENTAYMDEFELLSSLEADLLDRAVGHYVNEEHISCTACDYCAGSCPQDIPISKYFGLFNEHAAVRYATDAPDRYDEAAALGAGKASDCTACGACVLMCPQHLKIPKLMKTVLWHLEKRGAF